VTARKARQARSRLLANRIILAVLVLLVLAALYAAAGLRRPVTLTSAPAAASAGSLPVTSALLGCPAPGSAGATGGGIAAASAPGGPGQGQVGWMPLSQPGGPAAPKTVSSSPAAGQLTVSSVPKAPAPAKKLATLPSMAGGAVPTSVARGGLIFQASGADAQGLDVEQLGPYGQPTARCQPAGSDFWFLSPGAAGLHLSLFLLNTDSQPANAAVNVQTDSGPLIGASDSGIVVPPHGMVVQSLDKLLHTARAIALHVTTSEGRVVAAVRAWSGTSKPGIWLPPAQQPATTQFLTGLPSTTGTRELYITVPGGAPAQVKVTAVTPKGSYQPTGASDISLLGHLTTGVSIPSLSGFAGSIKVSANVPVTAVLEVSGGPSGAPGAFIGGADAITAQGVVAASPVGKLGTTQLVLSAPKRAASVRITWAAPGTPLTGQQGQVVQIPAKSSAQLEISLPRRSAKVSLVAILVTPLPGSGPVYAARLALVGGTVQSVLPVASSPAVIKLTRVRESLLAVLGSLLAHSSSG
jgi:hypothetical protein